MPSLAHFLGGTRDNIQWILRGGEAIRAAEENPCYSGGHGVRPTVAALPEAFDWARSRRFTSRCHFHGLERDDQKTHLYDSEGKMIGLKSGYVGDLWNALEMDLNFTCDWKEEADVFGGSCNATTNVCDGHMKYLATRERDVAVASYGNGGNRDVVLRVSMPIMENILCLYGKAQEEIPWWQVFFAPFHTNLWLTLSGLFLLLVLAAALITPLIGEDQVFSVFAMLLNQRPAKTFNRPFFLLISVSLYIIWTCFYAALTSGFASRNLFPFSSAVEFADSRWSLGVSTVGYKDQIQGNKDLEYITYKKRTPALLRGENAIKAVMTGSTALLGESKFFEKDVKDFSGRDRDVFRIKKIFTFPGKQQRCLVFAKDFPYARIFDLSLLKIREVGIFRRIETKWDYMVEFDDMEWVSENYPSASHTAVHDDDSFVLWPYFWYQAMSGRNRREKKRSPNSARWVQQYDSGLGAGLIHDSTIMDSCAIYTSWLALRDRRRKTRGKTDLEERARGGSTPPLRRGINLARPLLLCLRKRVVRRIHRRDAPGPAILFQPEEIGTSRLAHGTPIEHGSFLAVDFALAGEGGDVSISQMCQVIDSLIRWMNWNTPDIIVPSDKKTVQEMRGIARMKPCNAWKIGGPFISKSAAKGKNSRQVHVLFHKPSAFNLSRHDQESFISQGIWVFAGIGDFPHDFSVLGVQSQIYQLVSHAQAFQLVEHYRLNDSNMEVVDTLAEWLNGSWKLEKNQDLFLRRKNLRGIRLKCVTGPRDDQKTHLYDSEGKMIGLKSGYLGDLWNALEMDLNFTCDWKEEADVFGGSCNATTNACDGHMKYLATRERDVAVASYGRNPVVASVLRSFPTKALAGFFREKKPAPVLVRGENAIRALLTGTTALLGESKFFERDVKDFSSRDPELDAFWIPLRALTGLLFESTDHFILLNLKKNSAIFSHPSNVASKGAIRTRLSFVEFRESVCIAFRFVQASSVLRPPRWKRIALNLGFRCCKVAIASVLSRNDSAAPSSFLRTGEPGFRRE
ncbi:unnamed protein product [Darwinula stevensoni]|uniref:Uncharacterized protein n=1 Tax=Darwinula stevensoni TaxID=69355 RepID=A0A7R9A3Z9_9CRUS|nr:unnamed protein product [Darwinula stevensoni]CAG0882390.1 unnamed protein product [Darwinula stevensoni]